MLNNKQFRQAILIPALESIGLYTPSAEELLVATMAHESQGGTYVIQSAANGEIFTKGGKGIYQIETPTYYEVCLKLKQNTPLKDKVLTSCRFADIPPFEELIWNLRFATIIARINYARFAEPLPPANDLTKIWGYYKKYWNSFKGSATEDAFKTNYLRFTHGH